MLYSLCFVAVVVAGIVAGDEVALYGQCGGKEYDGATECEDGASCEYLHEYYSQCLPKSDDKEMVELHNQCGGKDWKGPTICANALSCHYQNEFYSLCIKVVNQIYQQCGGKHWRGSTACDEHLKCTFLNDYYSQCLPYKHDDGKEDDAVEEEEEEAEKWEQCGGKYFEGPTTCINGTECTKQNDYYSQCL